MEKTISKPMQRVVDALVAGEPVPADAQAALTDAERSDVAALARTAHLTKLTLAQPAPSAQQEALALARARDAYEKRRAGDEPPATPFSKTNETKHSPFRQFFRKLLGGFRPQD